MKKQWSQLQFIFTNRRFIIWGLVLFLLIGLVVSQTNATMPEGQKPGFWEDLTWWAKWLDPLLGTAVFLLTLVIGWTQLRDDWEESLEKRLTVIFKYQEREAMLCKKAYLSDEGDIRNLGQQIGSQMADNRDLKFKANDIQSRKIGVEANPFKKGKFLMHYEVVFELIALPNDTFGDKNLIWHEPDNTSLDNLYEWLPIKTVNSDTTEEDNQ